MEYVFKKVQKEYIKFYTLDCTMYIPENDAVPKISMVTSFSSEGYIHLSVNLKISEQRNMLMYKIEKILEPYQKLCMTEVIDRSNEKSSFALIYIK